VRPIVGLLLATAVAFAAILVRSAFAPPWYWLGVNLVLAWIPLVLGRIAVRGPAWLVLLGVPWLLFLPNAPYLLSDLVHLRARATVPMWFDAALLGGVGALGLAIGVRSLADVCSAIERWIGPWTAAVVRNVVPGLCGYAIWLGRYERWNSWDLLLRPDDVLAEILPTFLRPYDHPRTWAVTVTFAAVVLAATWIPSRDRTPHAARIGTP
jgi:uncharacterized membrane protein